MKKIVILGLCLMISGITSAQTLLGTYSNDDVELFSNGTTPRAKLTKDGYFLLGLTGAPSGATFTPGITFGACAGDFAILGGSDQGQLYISSDHEIRSSVYGYGSSSYNAGYYASILLMDASNVDSIPAPYPGGAMFLDGFYNLSPQRDIIMQYNRGRADRGSVLIGGYANNGNEKLQVSGGVAATGYAASIIGVTADHTATNDDYTIKADATSGNITITLPVTGVTVGRIFIIKRMDDGRMPPLGPTGNTLTINNNIDGASTASIVNQYESMQLQWDGTGYVRIN
jgi:hypothetical protein